MTHVKQSTKTIFALAFGLLLLAGGYAAVKAQETDPSPEESDRSTMQGMKDCPMMQGMMGQGMQQMHQRMMEQPRMRLAAQVHLLPALTDTLSLSEEQVARLEEEKQRLTERQDSLRQAHKAKREQIQEALAAEAPNLDEVETLLSERAELEAEKELALYRTADRMKAVLSDEQRARLAELDPQEMHEAMMAHLPMQDVTDMMQSMQGECPMMGGMGSMMQGMEDCPMMQNQRSS